MTVQRGSKVEPSSVSRRVLHLDGKGDVALDGFPRLREAGTVEAWVRFDCQRSARTGLLTAMIGKHRVINVHLPYKGRVYWDAGEAGGYDRIDRELEPGPLSERWIHWAFVKDSAREWMGIYADGELVLDEHGHARAFGETDRAWIGRGVKHRFTGALSELRVWRVARTPAQIRGSMHQRASGHEMGLVGHWPLDEGEGERVFDRTSYRHDGVITGGTWVDAELELAPARPIPATGLEDYGYWLRWSRMQQLREADGDEPGERARRGRIWS